MCESIYDTVPWRMINCSNWSLSIVTPQATVAIIYIAHYNRMCLLKRKEQMWITSTGVGISLNKKQGNNSLRRNRVPTHNRGTDGHHRLLRWMLTTISGVRDWGPVYGKIRGTLNLAAGEGRLPLVMRCGAIIITGQPPGFILVDRGTDHCYAILAKAIDESTMWRDEIAEVVRRSANIDQMNFDHA